MCLDQLREEMPPNLITDCKHDNEWMSREESVRERWAKWVAQEKYIVTIHNRKSLRHDNKQKNLKELKNSPFGNGVANARRVSRGSEDQGPGRGDKPRTPSAPGSLIIKHLLKVLASYLCYIYLV